MCFLLHGLSPLSTKTIKFFTVQMLETTWYFQVVIWSSMKREWKQSTEILECMYVVSLTTGRNKNKLCILRRSKIFGHFWWSIFYLVLDGKGVYYQFNKAYIILIANHGFLGGTDSFFIIIAMRIWKQMYVHHWQLQMPNY